MKKSFCLTIISFIFTFTAYCQTTIPIDSAKVYVGKTVTVCSHVFGIKATDKVVLINLGAAYPASPLTIAILAKDFANFTTPPAEFYKNKKLCVTGIVELFKNKAEIVVSKPTDISLVE